MSVREILAEITNLEIRDCARIRLAIDFFAFRFSGASKLEKGG